MLPRPGTDPVSKSFFCHLHLCPDLNLFIIKSLAPSGSSLFFFRSRLWSQRSRISGVTQGFLFRRCVPRSSAAVSVTALLKWVTMESRSASSSTSVARGANLPPMESTHHCWIIQFLEVEPDSWLGWFP